MQPVHIPYPQEYSIYTQELLAKPPSWILRCGGSLITAILAMMVILSYLIKYPDIISSQVTITTPLPPLPIIARKSGELRWLKTPQDLAVGKGDTIAIIDNPASVQDVYQLKQWLLDYQAHASDKPALKNHLILGDVQNQYANFQKLLNEFRFFTKLNPLAKKILSTQQKQRQLQVMLHQYYRQKSLLVDEYALIKKKLGRFQKLQHKNLIAETKIDEIKITLLKNQRQQQQLSSDITKTKLELTNLDVNLLEYKLSNQQKLQDFKLKLNEALQSLLSDISKWEERYLLKSPIQGQLTLSRFWSEHQFVKVGEEVVTVVPDNTQPIIAKVKMPMKNSGKVKPGQKILIKLAAYPYQEYGQLESRVDSISLVPRENSYTIEARLSNPLLTSFNKTINFNQEMQGKAEIVTEDLRLIERFYYQILKILRS